MDQGFISPTDLNLFQYAETAQEVWDLIMRQHGAPSAPGKVFMVHGEDKQHWHMRFEPSFPKRW